MKRAKEKRWEKPRHGTAAATESQPVEEERRTSIEGASVRGNTVRTIVKINLTRESVRAKFLIERSLIKIQTANKLTYRQMKVLII